jgi:hypothetical protein
MSGESSSCCKALAAVVCFLCVCFVPGLYLKAPPQSGEKVLVMRKVPQSGGTLFLL